MTLNYGNSDIVWPHCIQSGRININTAGQKQLEMHKVHKEKFPKVSLIQQLYGIGGGGKQTLDLHK